MGGERNWRSCRRCAKSLTFSVNIEAPFSYGSPTPSASRVATVATGALLETLGVHLFSSDRIKEWAIRQDCALQGKPYNPDNYYCLEEP